MNTSEVLNRAADRLERDGWWSPSWVYDPESPQPHATCAANALWQTVGEGGVLAEPARSALLAHIGGRDIGDIFDWNDHPDRTPAEVIGVLRACAVIEQAREEQDAAWATYAGLVTA